MGEYYYSEDGRCIDPKTEDEMRQLIADEALSRTTLCWTADLRSQWKPIGKTSLWSMTQTRSGPPPLSPPAISSLSTSTRSHIVQLVEPRQHAHSSMTTGARDLASTR